MTDSLVSRLLSDTTHVTDSQARAIERVSRSVVAPLHPILSNMDTAVLKADYELVAALHAKFVIVHQETY